MNFKFFVFFLTIIAFLFFSFGKIDIASAAVQSINTEAESYSLTNPTVANAGIREKVKTIYEFLKDPGEAMEVNMRTWVTSALITAAENGVVSAICGGEFTDENFIAQSNEETVEGSSRTECFETDSWAIAKYGEYGRVPGGLASNIGYTLAYVVDEAPVPTDMALFLNDTFDDTLFGQDVYAFTGPFPDGIYQGVFSTWKIFRNLAVSLLVLVLGIIGIMVMLRYKINPQVVASVYNTLPYVPIGIAFILLSYPIVTMFMGTIWPLTQFAFNVGNKIAFDMLPALGTMDSFIDVISVAINNIIYNLNPVNIGTVFISSLAMVITCIMFVVALVKLLFIYARFALYVIASPFVGLIYILPGKQKILTDFLKKTLADVLAIPLMVLALVVGAAFVASGGSASGEGGSSADKLALLSGFSVYWQYLKVIIGLSIIWQSRKVDKMLKESFQVQKGIFYNAPPKR